MIFRFATLLNVQNKIDFNHISEEQLSVVGLIVIFLNRFFWCAIVTLRFFLVFDLLLQFTPTTYSSFFHRLMT